MANTRLKNILSITKNIQGKKIKFIGDSIIAGNCSSDLSLTGDTIYDSYKANVGTKCWVGQLKIYLESNFGCTVNNYGISGKTSIDLVNNLSNLIKSDDDIVICMIGTNNRKITDGLAQLQLDLKTIYDYAKNLNKEIIFISPPPASSSSDSDKLFTCKDIDNAYTITCSKLNIEYISLYKEFIKYFEIRNEIYEDYLEDGLHPKDKGHVIISKIILNLIGFSYDNYNNNNSLEWEHIPLSNASAYPNFEPQFLKNGNDIILRGSFTSITEDNLKAGSVEMGVLPIGKRPSKNFYTYNAVDEKGLGTYCIGISASTGSIYFRGANCNVDSSSNFHLENIRFSLI